MMLVSAVAHVTVVQGRVVEAILMAHDIDQDERLVEWLCYQARCERDGGRSVRDGGHTLMAILMDGRDACTMPKNLLMAYAKASANIAHALISRD